MRDGWRPIPARLEEIENRLEEIDRLKRKYGSTLEEILLLKEEDGRNSWDHLLPMKKNSPGSKARLEPLQQEVILLAKGLSEERKRVASELKKVDREGAGFPGNEKDNF